MVRVKGNFSPLKIVEREDMSDSSEDSLSPVLPKPDSQIFEKALTSAVKSDTRTWAPKRRMPTISEEEEEEIIDFSGRRKIHILHHDYDIGAKVEVRTSTPTDDAETQSDVEQKKKDASTQFEAASCAGEEKTQPKDARPDTPMPESSTSTRSVYKTAAGNIFVVVSDTTDSEAPPASPINLTVPRPGELKLRPYPEAVYEVHPRLNRYAYLSTFAECTALHFREFQVATDGSKFPTKKGIRMKAHQAKMFLHYYDDIREYCFRIRENKRYHLGGHLYVTVDHDFGTSVVFHHWYYDEELDQPIPTKKRISVSIRNLEIFNECLRKIVEAKLWKDLDDIELPCIVQHAASQNQEDLANCRFCTPPGVLENI
jgi:hypothetical protein